MLRSHGHEVIEYTRTNTDIENVSAAKLLRQTLWSQRSFDELSKLLRDVAPDVLHCTNTLPLLSTSVYDAAYKYQVPVVQSLRNYRLFCAESMCMRGQVACQACLGKKFAFKAIWNRCYRGSLGASATVAMLQTVARRKDFFADRVHAYYTLSEFARRKIAEHGLPAERIMVKPNFMASVPDLGSGDGNYAIFVGRLAEAKGVRVMLRAWESLDVPLKIVGDGPLSDMVREHAAANRQIEWLGEQELEAVYPLVARAKFLVFPSIGLETFGRTLMEAYSVGTPVIAARESTVPETVVEGEIGFTYDPLDHDQLRQLVISSFAIHDYQRLRQNARSYFVKHFSPSRNYELLMGIYEQARRNAGAATETV